MVAAETDSPAAVIPADALLSRVHAHATTWCAVPELAGLSDAEVGGFRAAGMTVLACRVGAEVFAYHDRCPACAGSLAGARLSGAVLRCPHCTAGFDVVQAGAGVDGRDDGGSPKLCGGGSMGHGRNLGEQERIEPRSALSRPHWLKSVPAFLFL